MKYGLEVEMLRLKQLEFEELAGEYKEDAKPSFFMTWLRTPATLVVG